MNLPLYSYLPILAGLIGAFIGGRIYKKNQRKKREKSNLSDKNNA